MTAAKQRAEAQAQRSAEQAAQARQEAMDARTEVGAMGNKLAEVGRLVAEREAEIGSLRAQLRAMAGAQAELEAQVARDLRTLTSETAEAQASKQSLAEQLAVRAAEIEALRAELSAAKAFSRVPITQPLASLPVSQSLFAGAARSASLDSLDAHVMTHGHGLGASTSAGGYRLGAAEEDKEGDDHSSRAGGGVRGAGSGYNTGASSLTSTPARESRTAGVGSSQGASVPTLGAALAQRIGLGTVPSASYQLGSVSAGMGLLRPPSGPVQAVVAMDTPFSPESPGAQQRMERLQKARQRFTQLQQSTKGLDGSEKPASD